MTRLDKVVQAKSMLTTHLRRYISQVQLRTLFDMLKGEEAEWFADKIIEIVGVIDSMPVTYATDGQGEDAVVHLHYFVGGCDWWITEKDVDGGIDQAYGWASLFGGGIRDAEPGYISIAEIVAPGVAIRGELDLHWTPKTVREIKGKA
jgi:hypothetical protein